MVTDSIETDELLMKQKHKNVMDLVAASHEVKQPIREPPANLTSESMEILHENFKVMLGMNYLTPPVL